MNRVRLILSALLVSAFGVGCVTPVYIARKSDRHHHHHGHRHHRHDHRR